MTTPILKIKVLAKPVIKGKMDVRFPASVLAIAPILLSKIGGIFTFSLDINALIATLASTFVVPRTQRIVTAAGAVTALPTDDIIIIKKSSGAATTVNVNWSQLNRPLTIVDGKGDAATNNISIVPTTGQTQYAVANGIVVIDGNGGSVTLTPLADGSGAF